MSRPRIRSFTSHAFQLSSLVVHGDSGAVVDPGYFPDEIARIRRTATRGGQRVQLCLVTHGDFDHVAGAAAFPEALVVGHHRLADAELAARNLAAWAAFDAELYVDRAARSMPTPDVAVVGPTRLALGSQEVWAVPTPGHSADHLAFFFPAWGVAHVGDMLSALEFPFVEVSPRSYLSSLAVIEARLLHHRIRRVIVGHGPGGGIAVMARRLARDRAYLERLETGAAAKVFPPPTAPWWGEAPVPEPLRAQHARNLECARRARAEAAPDTG